MCCTLEVLLCTLLINPLQLGRGRIICKHRKKVYNKYVSGIINKGMYMVNNKRVFFVKNRIEQKNLI